MGTVGQRPFEPLKMNPLKTPEPSAMPTSASPHSIVSLRGLGVTLTGAAGAVEILRGIDLDLAPGETVSVVGPSGAGKTTLLMIVGGLEALVLITHEARLAGLCGRTIRIVDGRIEAQGTDLDSPVPAGLRPPSPCAP